MIESRDTIICNEKIGTNIFKMRLKPEVMPKMLAGQFVNIKVEGYSLRRPFGLCSIHKDTYDIIYRVQGDGTRKLSEMKEGDVLSVLEPLGTPFPIHEEKDNILILGGGIGTPPLYEVAKQYRKLNKNVTVILGFNDASTVICEADFKALGCDVYITTIDGSYGAKGTVIDAAKHHNITNTFVYSCGALGMLRAVSAAYQDGYISAEARMACGIGACMGCVCKDNKDKNIYYRICKEGPVFPIGKVEL